MAPNTSEMWSNGIKIAFFFLIAKNRPATGAIAPRPQFVMRLPYTTLLNTSPNLDLLTIALSPIPLSEILVTSQHQATVLIFYFRIVLPHKNFSFKVSTDVFACDLWFSPPK